MLQAVERPVRLEQGVLDGIFGVVADEPPRDRVQPRELLFGKHAKPLLGGSLSFGGSGITILKDARVYGLIASFRQCNNDATPTSSRRQRSHETEVRVR
jgi:hypothetical protein